MRLDQLLVAGGWYESREKAQAAILAGQVTVTGRDVVKPGTLVAPDADISVSGGARFVSRGGDKLAGALDRLELGVVGLVALDAGSATGGFVDCLLQRGAAHVVAVDVGYGQLAWRLREDQRVTVIERQNLRHLTPGMLKERLPAGVAWPGLVTLDLSFIGLDKVLPAVRLLVEPGGLVLALVKPQFEVGPKQVGKRGVVRRPELHRLALQGVAAAAEASGFTVIGLTYSDVRGPQGNIEYFLLSRAARAGQEGAEGEPAQLEKTGESTLTGAALEVAITAVVEAAWRALED